MAGKTPKLQTVNPQPQTPSRSGSSIVVRKTPKRHRRCDLTVKTRHGPLVRKTTKLHRRSEHNIKSTQPALSGSHVKLRKTPMIQVEVPLDVVAYQILTRLPVQTLCTFRCVSKPLCSFISDPHFRKEQARLSPQTPLLLAAQPEINRIRFSTCTIDGHKILKDFYLSLARPFLGPLKLVHSCRGLVCFTTFLMGGELIVFNPSTAEVTTLSGPEPSCVLTHGFGYTHISDEFKVVRFFTRDVEGDFDDRAYGPERKEYFSEVFTLGSSDGWRETRSRPPFAPYRFSRLPLVHGALHYLPCPYYHPYRPGKQHDHHVTAFDVHTEQYRLIPLPKIHSRLKLASSTNQCQITELRGSLCLSCFLFRSKQMLQLWFLKDYDGGKWVKECNVDFDYRPVHSESFAVTGDGFVLIRIQLSERDCRLCYYDTQKKCIASIFPPYCSAVFYVDSFLPLPFGNRMNIKHTPEMIRSTQERGGYIVTSLDSS